MGKTCLRCQAATEQAEVLGEDRSAQSLLLVQAAIAAKQPSFSLQSGLTGRRGVPGRRPA